MVSWIKQVSLENREVCLGAQVRRGDPRALESVLVGFELSATTRHRIETEILPAYPRRHSAILPVLWAIQEEKGCIEDAAMEYVAGLLDVSAAHVLGVRSFYTMFHGKPIGRYHIQVCKTLSCEVMGSQPVCERLKQVLGIGPGETTADGLFTLSQVECLGACELAPVVQVNDDLYGPLSPEMVDILIEDLRAGSRRMEPCL